MITIRARLNLIALMTILMTGVFVYEGLREKARLTSYYTEIDDKIALQSILLSLAEQTYSHEHRAELQTLQKKPMASERSEAINDIIDAYKARNQVQLRQQVDAFMRKDQENYKALRQQILASSEELLRHIALAILTPLFGLIWTLRVVRVSIFKFLERLGRRMMDFLNDRYSFKFAEPEENELGDLQRTFNALAQRVINTMDELKSLDQAKSDFLNITSHELRTPMTSIKGSLNLISSGMIGHVDASCRQLLKIAESEVDRMIRLINDLLDLAKIEVGKLPLTQSWASWDELTGRTAAGLMGFAHKSNVRIAIDPIPGLEAHIDCDRVQQVLTNLISNAIKFSPSETVVHVSTGYTESGELLVNVRDQGPGISDDDQAELFQKFKQGANSSSGSIKGTGLGLAIAKALVEEHGGRIGVESRLGEGSVFWFTLPEWRNNSSTSTARKGA